MEGGYKIISMKENDLYTDDGTKTTIEALDKFVQEVGRCKNELTSNPNINFKKEKK